MEKDKIILTAFLQKEIYNWLKYYQAVYDEHLPFEFDEDIKLGKIDYKIDSIKRIPSSEVEKVIANNTDYNNKRSNEINPQKIITVNSENDISPLNSENKSELENLRKIISNCNLCDLSKTRTNTVFGEGSANAKIVLVGEAPGEAEDKSGLPFVGKSGKLLEKMLLAIGIEKEDVFICNVLKCRPPQNRDPKQNEIDKCAPYLTKQLEILKPKIILALGRYAAIRLLNVTDSMKNFRKEIHQYHNIPLIVTYHPSALLRNPKWKYPAWEDLKKLKAMLSAHESNVSTQNIT